ncbi:unnamed protein product [Paramecium sonneborni]|uniref:Uncharacterized protein n=1 Tax=Paramecium sonneborni TaxID=65129 RepID=A0A8S1MV02_9CILI|nr:unnamed protein product [Paramecium sonneborni]
MNENMRKEGILNTIKLQIQKEIVDKLIKETKKQKKLINLLQISCKPKISFSFLKYLFKNIELSVLIFYNLNQLYGLTIRDYEQHLFQLYNKEQYIYIRYNKKSNKEKISYRKARFQKKEIYEERLRKYLLIKPIILDQMILKKGQKSKQLKKRCRITKTIQET